MRCQMPTYLVLAKSLLPPPRVDPIIVESAHKFRPFSASREKFQGSGQTKEVHDPQKDEDITFRSLQGRHFQPICINRRPRAVNMFAHQIEGIAAFAREHPLPALSYLILINIFLYIFFTEVERYNARIAGFKGPSGFPIIGNIWQIRTNAAEQYRRWAKEFGAVYQIQLGNVPVVVVNSAAAARAIFGQNAQALSSRPEFYTFHKVGDPVLHLSIHPHVSRSSPVQQGPQSGPHLSATR